MRKNKIKINATKKSIIYSYKYKLPSPKSFDKQLLLLKRKHHLNLKKDSHFNNTVIKNINYYKIYEYGKFLGLLCKSNENNRAFRFRKKFSISHVYNGYIFDNILKNIFTFAIGFIEKNIRCQMSCYLTTHYKDSEFLSRDDIWNSDDRKKWIYSIKDKIRTHGSQNEKANEYFNKNNGHMPLWIIIESFSFNDLLKLFNFIPDIDKKEVAKIYGLDIYRFNNSLKIIKVIRNICCHFNSLITKESLINSAKWDELGINANNSSTMYTYLKIILYFLKESDSFQFKFVCYRIERIFNLTRNNIILNKIGIPVSKWKRELTKMKIFSLPKNKN